MFPCTKACHSYLLTRICQAHVHIKISVEGRVFNVITELLLRNETENSFYHLRARIHVCTILNNITLGGSIFIFENGVENLQFVLQFVESPFSQTVLVNGCFSQYYFIYQKGLGMIMSTI